MDLFDLNDYFEDRDATRHVACPSLVMGAKTDLLFPIEQQQQMAKDIENSGLLKLRYVATSVSVNRHLCFMSFF